MFTFFKRPHDDVSRTTPGFEETERRTPKTGIVLLVLMFVAGIYFGLFAMDDLANIPNRPESLSSCAYRYETDDTGVSIYGKKAPTYYAEDMIRSLAYEDSSSCEMTLSPLETTAGLLERRIVIENQLKPVITEYLKVERDLSSVRMQLERATNEYGVGLQEKGVGVSDPVFPTAPTQQSITQLRQQEAPLVARLNELQKQVDAFRPSLDAVDKELTAAYVPIFAQYKTAMRWYEFKVFLLQFLLIIPFFFLALKKYLALYRKNSPYTVILTTIIAVLGILLLKTILFWFWGLFLAEILKVLIGWFGKYAIFRSLLTYLGMLLSFAIFGGAVYFLQKRVFDSRRVTIRRFRAKQCPQCQTNLDLADMYCPNCGAHTREACPKCGKERFVGMPFCPHCGDKKEL